MNINKRFLPQLKILIKISFILYIKRINKMGSLAEKTTLNKLFNYVVNIKLINNYY